MIRYFIFLLLSTFGFGQEAISIQETISPIVPHFDCHSPCIEEVKPGVLCVVWKGGPGSGKSNIDMSQNVGIWLSHYEEGKWSLPVQVVSAPQSVCWNPVLFQHPSGELFLFFRMGQTPRNAVALLKRSYDGGYSWTKEEVLPAGIYGPTKAKPIIDSMGNLICGSSMECGEPSDPLKATACWIEIADSSATNWKKYGPIEIPGRRFGALEPSLFRDQHGTLGLLCRDRAAKIGLEGWIWTSTSPDEGKTWSELRPTALPNPDSGIDTVNLDNGDVVVTYNHSHKERFPLRMAISKDGGTTLQPTIILEQYSGETPSMLVSSDSMLHIVYAWAESAESQRIIKHVVVNPLDLENE